MKKYMFLFLSIIYLNFLYALPINFSQNSINFGNIEINTIQNYDIYLKNVFHLEQEISISKFLSEISLSDSLLIIPPQDSVLLNISFIGKTNILFESVIIFNNQFNHNPLYMPVTASCYLPLNRYSTTYNLYDNELKNELYSLINNHTSLGYDSAREFMYGTLDNVDGFVQCVYTGVWVNEDDIPGGTIMNCEHTWPQSMGAEGTAKSDLYHLYPTDSNSNSVRGNLPFGIVTGNPDWQQGGSKRGTNSQGFVVFEPRDEHKGSTARSMIYFAIRYNNPSAPFFNNQESLLKNWNNEFPVSENELTRNNGIAGVQGKRNPFIDHPEFANRIYSISTNAQTPINLDLKYPSNILFETGELCHIPLFNSGNSDITIQDIQSDPIVEIEDFPEVIQQNQIGYIELMIFPQTHLYNSPLNISTNYGNITINLYTNFTSNQDTVTTPIFNFSVYPNPVLDSYQINISNFSKKNSDTSLSIYNIKGQLIERIDSIKVDKSNNLHFPINQTSGVYFFKLSNCNQQVIKKVLYLK
ncbi:MAG: endonuclease [Candidatus Cloacimonetes bacterium]|nr:endonuclease [Candidatus Cloacimonadota bacterium]